MQQLVGAQIGRRRGHINDRVQHLACSVVTALVLTQCACQSSSDSLNGTLPTDVAALRAFQKALYDPGGRLRSWRPNVDPCGSPDCSLAENASPIAPQAWHSTPSIAGPVKRNSSGIPPCNYIGLSCHEWRVERILLSCTGVDSTCTALQGSLAEELGNLTELKVLDLERNQIRSTIPDALGRLSELEVIRMGYNRFYGELSPKWVGMKNLQILDIRQNTLTGVLPSAWGALYELKTLHVEYNSLTGYLPASFGNLHDLRVLSLGSTAVVGMVPASWANMTSLQALDVSNNCGICGNLPTFPPSVLAKLQVDSQGSGLGWTCNRNTCAAFPISILAQAVICMSIVGGLILLCLVRRLLFYYYPGLIFLSPTAMYMHRHRGSAEAARQAQELAQQTSDVEAGNVPGKQRMAAVILNPDSTYSYALKEEELPNEPQCAKNTQPAEASTSVASSPSQVPGDQAPPSGEQTIQTRIDGQ